MLFRNKLYKKKPKTYIEIQIDENKTNICIYEEYGSKRGDSISLDYGFENILEKSYEEARFFDKQIKETNLELFLYNHYNKVQPNIRAFISRIEFLMLCKMRSPAKIERIYLKGNGSKLFSRELKQTFPNCYI